MSVISKKLTAEELQSVKSIRQDYSNLAYTLGDLELQKATLLENQKELVNKEKQIAKQLQEKYGQGTIDLETGEVKA